MSNHQYQRDSDALSHDTAIALLSNECRREVIVVLANRCAPVSLDELAALVASPDVVGDPEDDPRDLRRRTRIRLHHHHLPKLDAAGVLDYDPAAKTVTPTGVDRVVDAAATALADV